MAGQDWDLIVWRQAHDLLQQVERIHRNFLNAAAATQYRALLGRTPSWEPQVNVVETDASLWVIISLAGVAADRLEVRLEGDELVIAGDRPLPDCCHEGQLKLWEIALGRFERRLRLSGAENLQLQKPISFQNGLLTLELRKQT